MKCLSLLLWKFIINFNYTLLFIWPVHTYLKCFGLCCCLWLLMDTPLHNFSRAPDLPTFLSVVKLNGRSFPIHANAYVCMHTHTCCVRLHTHTRDISRHANPHAPCSTFLLLKSSSLFCNYLMNWINTHV